jgi:uncharacterized protein (DUF58 family)
VERREKKEHGRSRVVIVEFLREATMISFSKRSLIALGLSIALAIIIGIVVYKWPSQADVINLILVLVGVVITIALENRFALEDLKEEINAVLPEVQVARKIRDHGLKDVVFLLKYEELRTELNKLSTGTYRLRSLDEIYHDDMILGPSRTCTRASGCFQCAPSLHRRQRTRSNS